MHRLFVALRPPPDIRDALSATMSGIEGARWQTDNQLHLTLAFIGEVDRHQAQAAADALSLVRAPALDLKLGLPGTFDAARPGRTGTLWIGVEPPDGLANLAQTIRTHLRRAGLPSDPRKFTPHITLARFSNAGAPREALHPWLSHSPPPPLHWQASEFHLVESTLGHEGAHYAPVVCYPLP